MSTQEADLNKSSVSELEFDSKTAKRAVWEAYEFTVTAENQIQVVNASYGAEKDEHVYHVTVDEQADGTLVPIFCSCPAYMYADTDCKHLVAAAARPVVLAAAFAYPGREQDDQVDRRTVMPDGGVLTDDSDVADEHTDCTVGKKWCPGPRESPDDPLPCFRCFQVIDE